MILFRLDKLTGRFCDVAGGQDQYSYNGDNIGWMPIESMNFGFNDSSKKKAGGTAGAAGQQGQTAGRTGASGGASGAASQAATGAAGGADEAFQGIQINRFVDMASAQLMQLAMEDRKEDHPTGNPRIADFHFLHSVMGDKSVIGKETTYGRFIFPYMLITLDNVLIKSWNITATGDDRPSENISLWYEKAAIRYYRTKDGQVWIGGDVAGWDQQKNAEWRPDEGKHTYFREPKKR